MKNKRRFVVGILVVLSLGLMGCSAQSSATQSSENAPTASKEEVASEGEEMKGTQQRQRADVVGEISSIVGNEVVLKLAEMPQRSQGQGGEQAQQRQQSQSGGGGMPEGGPSGSGMPGGFGGPPGGGAGTGQSTQRRMALNYTGESKTFLLPIGIPIVTMSKGENGIEEQEVELGDLKKGDILQVWYADKEQETISKISVTATQ